VQRIGSCDHPKDADTLDELISALQVETHEQVVVVAANGHFELLPIAG
jgi:hypothetical protein